MKKPQENEPCNNCQHWVNGDCELGRYDNSTLVIFGYCGTQRPKEEPNKQHPMIRAEIEIHDDHMLLSIPTDDTTSEIETRLTSDGWDLATNGYKENEKWYTIYEKRI